MTDIIIIAIILVIVGAAIAYIIKAKKSGVKCIGCPSGGKCDGCKACGEDVSCLTAPLTRESCAFHFISYYSSINAFFVEPRRILSI